jgi:methylated-DNA-[protein]-cysteine S-methyltransferase
MMKMEKPYWLSIFPSSLGYFAVLGQKDCIKELTFGHPSVRAAKKALSPNLVYKASALRKKPLLAGRLLAYSRGASKDDFCDIPLDLDGFSLFQRRILLQCRKIPFGTTLSYAQLAARAGSPRAYRAIGNCMAANKLPILIPCHRVVCANGRLGSYSAPGGMRMKKRLLDMEKRLLKNS